MVVDDCRCIVVPFDTTHSFHRILPCCQTYSLQPCKAANCKEKLVPTTHGLKEASDSTLHPHSLFTEADILYFDKTSRGEGSDRTVSHESALS